MKRSHRAGSASFPVGSPFLYLIPAALAAALAWTAVSRKSVTVDEFGNLPAGLAILVDGAFHVDPGSPPLSKALAALGPLFLGAPKVAVEPIKRASTSWQLGYQFVGFNFAGYHELFMQGRAISVLFLLAACLLAVGYARSLYGVAGSWLCAGTVFFIPDLLAHGALVTTDIYLAAAIVGTLWAFDGYLRAPSPRTGAALGAAAGLAVLFKFTAALLFALLPVSAWLVLALRRRPGPEEGPLASGRDLLRWAPFAFAAAVLVIDAGYGFRAPLSTLGSFEFPDGPFARLQAALPSWLPVPLPARLVEGVAAQLSERGYNAYLLGRLNDAGFWNYYLVGFLVKMPLAWLLGVAAATCITPRLRLREVPLAFTSASFFLFFSLAGHKNIGLRYLLFLVPLGCVWLGRIAASAAWGSARWRKPLRWACAGAVASTIATASAAWPDYLAFFNAASGGSARGHRYLLDSNLDWGQDLLALRRYMREQGIGSVHLAYFGRVPPEVYGIRYKPYVGGHPPAGPVVISANFLWGLPYWVNSTDYWLADRDAFKHFRNVPPSAVLGHTLYVFDRQ